MEGEGKKPDRKHETPSGKKSPTKVVLSGMCSNSTPARKKGNAVAKRISQKQQRKI